MADKETQSQEDPNKEKPIKKTKPLKLSEVTTTRGKMTRALRNIGILTGIGIAGGAVGGYSAENKFRDISKFNPDWREHLEDRGGVKKENEEPEKEETPEEVEKETQGILSRIGGVLGKAKEMSEEAIKKIIDETVAKIMEKYGDAERKMLEKYYTAMEEIDNLVFWGSFWSSFAITIILALGAIKLKKMLLGEGNPELVALEKQMLRMQGKINEMITKQNAMLDMQFVSPKDKIAMVQEAQKLLREYDSMPKIND